MAEEEVVETPALAEDGDDQIVESLSEKLGDKLSGISSDEVTEPTPAEADDQKPAPVESGPENPESQAVQLSEALVAKAESFNLDASKFEDDKALATAIAEKMQEQPATEASEVPDTSAPAEQPPEASGLDKLDYPDDLVNTLKVMHQTNQALQQRLATLEGHYDGIRQEEQRREAERFAGEFDQKISSLGEAWKDTFGEGSLEKLHPQSPEVINRLSVMEEVQALRLADMQLGRNTPIEGLVKRALVAVFPNKLESITKGKLVESMKAKADEIIEMPQQKSGYEAKTEASVLRKLSDVMREKGLT